MVERTSSLPGTSVGLLELRTEVCFVVERVVAYFLPAMTGSAMEGMRTSIFIIVEELVPFPMNTFLQLITILSWFAPEVLPIVTVFTLATVMFKLVERTVDCFEMKHVEVNILFESVDQRHSYFLNVVGK